MRKIFLCAAAAVGIVSISTVARSAMPMTDKPQITSVIESVVCIGDRRTYKNFNHCVTVLGPKNSRFCSKICRQR